MNDERLAPTPGTYDRCYRNPRAFARGLHFRSRQPASESSISIDSYSILRIPLRPQASLSSREIVDEDGCRTRLQKHFAEPLRDHANCRSLRQRQPTMHRERADRRGLGSVRLLDPEQIEDRLGADRLGPDALVITVEQLAERLGTRCHHLHQLQAGAVLQLINRAEHER